LLVYVSAWLRCHEMAAFTAGLLNSQPMGFYPPSMLVREAQRSGVEVRGVDVMHSDWDCTLEPDDTGRPAIRLGLREIRGLPEKNARAIMTARAVRPFASAADLVHRAALDERARRLLADAGALAALAGHRHQARWTMLGAERLPGILEGCSAVESPQRLRAPREGEDIAYDYAALGLTLGRHPVALLRPRLAQEQILRAADLEDIPTGRQVRVGGVVMFRQRPATASGVVFVSLEDETGIVNLIVWPGVVDEQRAALLGSRLMVVSGELQKEGGVIHVIAQRIEDRSAWLGRIETDSRDFR
jgi:error-prone DNA polymerase